jgi:superfamily II DNA/RNA helicase
MNVSEVHRKVIADYEKYIRSFIRIADPEIEKVVNEELSQGKLWPEPLLQFNPAFQHAGKVADLAAEGTVHQRVADIFKGYSLYQHQLDAIKLGASGKDFVVTSGTGSGKSLTYIGTVFSHLLRNPGSKGVVAIVVYPLNALINSQSGEFRKYQENYQKSTGNPFPITFGQYTGQEEESKRIGMRETPPQILLTNYTMLELLLTRLQERSIRDAIYENLKYLIFDELHTYRGRQGSDVAMLIRRIRARCTHDVICIGTSATMVSGGSVDNQRSQVAEVATKLFGKPFNASQIVNETLARSIDASNQPPSISSLAAAIEGDITPSEDVAELRLHPVAQWIEREAAIEERDGTLVRRRPRSVGDLAKSLSDLTQTPEGGCRKAIESILLWISTVNAAIQRSGSRATVLPFRLHQFISQTGSVYTTLDQGKDRYISLEPGIYKSDDANQKPIFPNVFSRTSGHPFICVSLQGSRLLPREFMDNSEDEESNTDGYLIIGDVWNPEEDMDSLPDSWFRRNRSGRRILPEREEFLPQRIYFDEYGNCSTNMPMKYDGWFMRAPLLFDPTSGTFFDTKTRDGTKLAKLGSEGRSTSTTITTFSILTQLQEAGYKLGDQKLISFTDNRQDAALQAGHFNDFVSVIHLRSGIYHALLNAAGNQLNYTQIGDAVFSALDLPFSDFSTLGSNPTLAHVEKKYKECFQNFIFYRALADLRRSWRIVLPNLEQCGLLAIDYDGLDEIAGDDSFWSTTPILRDLNKTKRRDFLTVILDFFRLEYALHSNNFLDPNKIKENEKRFRENLREPWTIDEKEGIQSPRVIRLDPLSTRFRHPSSSMGSASGLGKYIKQFVKQESLNSEIVAGDLYRDFILNLMNKLKEADYLQCIMAESEAGPQVPTYRLKVESILWKLGDGKRVKTDVIKRRSFRNYEETPNTFFAEMYKREFNNSKRLRAADHTGQLDKDNRLDREDRFKCDWWIDDKKTQPDIQKIRGESISALYCSPTMELGVDIGGLSVVHMRNAPPNSSNYAQRSGRAGRSGQGALVFTYCSTYSPHDRHYFQHQADLVAGAVQPPRLDLCNRELLLTHLNALAISEIGIPGLEGGTGSPPSLSSLVDMNAAGMPLSDIVGEGLKLSQATSERIRSTFKRAIYDFSTVLETKGNSWYSDLWIEITLNKLETNLDDVMKRWRRLYSSAKSSLSKASSRIESGALAASSEEYKRLVRQQHQATRQINLLVNDLGKRSSDLSEFYPYRYLASEGFLPGYNFTRLPLRVFIPTGVSSGEFISRPRAIALREFGPLNVIYHNGRKYRVEQLIVQDAESSLEKAWISRKSGYFMTGEHKADEICPFSKVNLSDNANREILNNLLEMSESRGTEVDRISCEEEERVSKGFEISTYFTLDGSMDRLRRAVVKVGDDHLLNFRYMPAARLVYVNRKWRSTQLNAFPLGMTSGFWKSSMPPLAEQQNEKYSYVTLWTTNISDSLYIEPTKPLGLNPDGVITLQHALKRGIEVEFQVESSEIGVVAVGDPESPNILVYEAAEGSLGILARLAEDPTAMHSVVKRAQEICRYDATDYKAKASYDDLLSYYNQRDHLRIDRFIIKDALQKLLIANVEIQFSEDYANYDTQYQELLQATDPNSDLERVFINYLYSHNLKLPDRAQLRTPDIYSQPDFYYEPRIWVFVDGSVHDNPEVAASDVIKRNEIRERGDEVVVYRYDQNLAELVASRPDIFKKIR